MTLFDVDTRNADRGSPQPNHPDKLMEGAIKSHATVSTSYSSSATAPQSRIRFANNVILYYDDQDRVIRVDGFIPSLAAYPVTIIAKYGYDVYVDILGLPSP